MMNCIVCGNPKPSDPYTAQEDSSYKAFYCLACLVEVITVVKRVVTPRDPE